MKKIFLALIVGSYGITIQCMFRSLAALSKTSNKAMSSRALVDLEFVVTDLQRKVKWLLKEREQDTQRKNEQAQKEARVTAEYSEKAMRDVAVFDAWLEACGKKMRK